jgi:hypothetical protein
MARGSEKSPAYGGLEAKLWLSAAFVLVALGLWFM